MCATSRSKRAPRPYAAPDINLESTNLDHEDAHQRLPRRLGRMITKFISMMVGGGG